MYDFSSQVGQLIPHLRAPRINTSGEIVRVVGLMLEAKGINAPLGAHCQVEHLELGTFIDAQVVGFNGEALYLMPFTEVAGIGPGARIWVRSNSSKGGVGSGLLGRVIDAQGSPLDGKEAIAAINTSLPVAANSFWIPLLSTSAKLSKVSILS